MPTREVLILAAGLWPKEPPSPTLVARADLIIATDAAWARATARGVRVDRVIGDLDSLQESEVASLRRSGTPTDVYPRDKDRTDLEIAIDEALLLGPDRIVIYGALGGRTDQILANVFLLEKVARFGAQAELVSGQESVFLVDGERVLSEVSPGDGVSLLPISDSARGVTTWGLKYELAGETLERASSRGVSNEVVALPAGLRVEEGVLVVVLRRASRGNGEGAPPE